MPKLFLYLNHDIRHELELFRISIDVTEWCEEHQRTHWKIEFVICNIGIGLIT